MFSRESVGEAEAVGDDREPMRLELGSDQMLIGESLMPSSQSIEFSFPIVFHKSISSGRIIIEADFDEVDEFEEQVELPVDDVICIACPNWLSGSFKSKCSRRELKPFLYSDDNSGEERKSCDPVKFMSPGMPGVAPGELPVRRAMCASI